MKSKQVLSTLGITRPTLTKYVKQGIIKVTKLPNGFYNYDDDSVYAFIGIKKQKRHRKIVSYARVSTYSQKEQLKSQTQRIYDYCMSNGISVDEQIEDIKSGMSFDRKGFQKLCELVISGEVELIVIENKDRLVRFGYESFAGIFRYFGAKILVINDTICNQTYEQELTQDLLDIIHYFSMKSYSHRRQLNKLKKELETNCK